MVRGLSATRRRRANPRCAKMDNKKYYVYVLENDKDKRKYTGFTAWLDLRLKQHNGGLVKSTRNRRPHRLIYKEEFHNKKEAQAREKFLKSGQGREFLKTKLLAQYPSG